jgi:hypothetical protein
MCTGTVRSSRFLKDTAKRVHIMPEDDEDDDDEEEVSNSEDSHHK